MPQPIARVSTRTSPEFLEARSAQPARIAGHYYEAEQWSRAGAHFKTAADRARSIAFGANAAELYRRTVESFDKAGQRTDRIEAMRMLATCMQHMKRFSEYSALAQQMVAIAVTPRERLWSIDCFAKSRFELTHDAEAIGLMREGRLLARELGDPVLEVNLAEWEALGLSFTGRQSESREVGQTLLAFIQNNPHDETIALRKRQYAYLLEMDNQFEQAIELLHDAAERARTDGDLGLVSETQVIRGACLYNLGHLDAAIDEYHAARRLQIENAGGAVGWTTYDVMLGRYLQEAGRYREAHQVLRARSKAMAPKATGFMLNARQRSRTASSHLARSHARNDCSAARLRPTQWRAAYVCMQRCGLRALTARKPMRCSINSRTRSSEARAPNVCCGKCESSLHESWAPSKPLS